MREVRFTDTTFRDGQASLWAEGMRTGMMLALAQKMDRAGFVAAEVIATSHFKKCVRDLREDPWERVRLVSKMMPNTKLAAMGYTPATFKSSPLSITELYINRLAANGIRRLQVMDAANDMTGDIVNAVAFAQAAGLDAMVALVFSESPKHTDEYYVSKAKEAASMRPNLIYLKDPGGLLTAERVRSIVPALLDAVENVPLEFHTHCTTGLGPMAVLAAVESGINIVHTAVPPLANGSSQPSIFNIASNLQALGYETAIDGQPLAEISQELFRMAKIENFPIGKPLEYDYSQYVHQVPGGVISNLRYQLTQMGMIRRLEEVLNESIQVRRDLGYPIMVTPFSQFVVSQAAINVLSGIRYRVVTDEVIGYVAGAFGSEASNGVDPDVRDHILDRPRAKTLRENKREEPSLKEIRGTLGGPGVSDDELLLRYVCGGEEEVAAMRRAGPFKTYSSRPRSIVDLAEMAMGGRKLDQFSLSQPGFTIKTNGNLGYV